jgi:hypothetical protein
MKIYGKGLSRVICNIARLLIYHSSPVHSLNLLNSRLCNRITFYIHPSIYVHGLDTPDLPQKVFKSDDTNTYFF